MSRTDVHAPYRVKERDPSWRHAFVEEHDHSDGVCDLDSHDPRSWAATRCHINSVAIGRNIHCGCQLCTGQSGRKRARRRERAAWRSARARLLAAPAGQRGELDALPIRRSAW